MKELEEHLIVAELNPERLGVARDEVLKKASMNATERMRVVFTASASRIAAFDKSGENCIEIMVVERTKVATRTATPMMDSGAVGSVCPLGFAANEGGTTEDPTG